jgi:hypothetical protein
VEPSIRSPPVMAHLRWTLPSVLPRVHCTRPTRHMGAGTVTIELRSGCAITRPEGSYSSHLLQPGDTPETFQAYTGLRLQPRWADDPPQMPLRHTTVDLGLYFTALPIPAGLQASGPSGTPDATRHALASPRDPSIYSADAPRLEWSRKPTRDDSAAGLALRRPSDNASAPLPANYGPAGAGFLPRSAEGVAAHSASAAGGPGRSPLGQQTIMQSGPGRSHPGPPLTSRLHAYRSEPGR